MPRGGLLAARGLSWVLAGAKPRQKRHIDREAVVTGAGRPAVGGHEHTGEARGLLVRGGIERHHEHPAAVFLSDGLRRRVVHETVGGEEAQLSGLVRGAGLGRQAQRGVFAVVRGRDVPARVRVGQLGAGIGNGLGPLGVSRGRGCDGKADLELRVSGHADVHAHEPLRKGRELDRRTRGEVGGRGDFHQEQIVPVVTVADYFPRAILQGMRRGPLDVAGSEALRQRPRERGRVAGAGGDPIAVPVRVVLHPERHRERLARRDGCGVGDEGGRHGALLPGLGFGGENEDRQDEQEWDQAGKLHLAVRVGGKEFISKAHCERGKVAVQPAAGHSPQVSSGLCGAAMGH